MFGPAPSSTDLAGNHLHKGASSSVHSTNVFRFLLDTRLCARGSLGMEGYRNQEMKWFPDWEDHLVQEGRTVESSIERVENCNSQPDCDLALVKI